MSNSTILEKLISLWAKDKLAHFYIIQPSPTQENPRDFTRSWTKNFLSKVIAEEKSISESEALNKLELGNSDILQITKEDENENYSVSDESFDEFFKFQNYRPLELKQRFIVIDDAHSITKILSNKLLKTLEEPAERTTILMLDPYRKKILPTISSRAIYIRVPAEVNQSSINTIEKLSDFLSENGFKEEFVLNIKKIESNRSNIMPLYDSLKGKKSLEIEFVDALTRYVNQRGCSYKELESFTNALKWYEKAAVFNNYSPEKLSGLMLTIN
ncbi:hypothetical protein [Halobacteriovorax sp.]|uniref:hypothetical protein n=1 Tax=Halobacteriovorax sp. TaxID=2020862 RepID=UPI003567FF39